ncbi:hypothetical protein GE09DRAFT_1222529 [Coniochaeta sp. 2T2.1]|nr:hypothetical protein GE09DRAFT_1222529 [Coniochaeta sp. 2T2.1]
MTDPLSICTSALAVATLAYNSVKTLHELFTSIRDAPKTTQDINADLSEISAVLLSFNKELHRIKGQPQPQTLSPELEACLTEVQPAIQVSAAACDAFKTQMQAVTSRSTAQRTSFRDRLKLHFRDADIASFKYRLGSYKSTLNIALAFASMKSTAKFADAVRELESTIEKNVVIVSIELRIFFIHNWSNRWLDYSESYNPELSL